MKNLIVAAVAAVTLVAGTVGWNALRVGKDRVVAGARELLPNSMRKSIAVKDLDDYRRDLASAAADVDLKVLPHYAAFLPRATFGELVKSDLRPFRTMVADLNNGSSKLESMLCVHSDQAADLRPKKDKLDRLASRAAKDLELMEMLKARFAELAEVERSLTQVTATDAVPEVPVFSESALDSVRSYIAERERESVVAKYTEELTTNVSEGLTNDDLAELRQVLVTLKVVSN